MLRAKLLNAIIKTAAPKWSRIFNALSSDSKSRIKNIQNLSTRQIGRTPLGQGNEGIVYQGFTPGKGDSAIKTFFDKPLENKISGGSKNLSSLSYGDSVSNRVADMQLRPEIHPEIYAQHPRGFVMERLSTPDLSNISLLEKLKHSMRILNLKKRLKANADDASNISWAGPINFGGNKFLKLNDKNTAMTDFYADSSNLRNIMLNKAGKYVIPDPVYIRRK